MLMPKRVKYRKTIPGPHARHGQGRYPRCRTANTGLQALEAGWITSRQIEAIRRSIVRQNAPSRQILIRIFPTSPLPPGGDTYMAREGIG